MDNPCLDEKTFSFLNMNNNKNTGSVEDTNFTTTPSHPCYQNVNQSNLSSNSSSGGIGGAGGRKGKKPQKYQQHLQEIPSFLPLTEADARKIKTEEENDSNYPFEAGKDRHVPSSLRNTAPVKISPYGIDAILSNNTQHAHTPKEQINNNNQNVMTHHNPVASSHMDLAEIIRQRLIQNAAKKLSSSTTIDPTVKPLNDGECINVKNSIALSRPLSKESFESSNQSHQTFCHEKNDRNDSTKGTNNTADIPIKRPRGRPPGSCNKNPKKSKKSPNSSVVNQPYLGYSNEGTTNVLNSSQDPSTVLSSFMDPSNFDMMKFFQFVQQNNTGIFPPVPPVPSFQDVQQKMAANAFDPLALWASTMNMLSTSSNQFNLPPTINSDTNYKKLTQDFMGNGNLENNETITNHMRNEVPKNFSSVTNIDPLKRAQDHEDIRHSKEIITPQSIKSSRNSSPISRTKGKSSKAKPAAVQGGIDAQQPIVKRSVGRPPKVPKIPITIGTVANNAIVVTSTTTTYSNPKNVNTDQNISFSNNKVGKNINEIEISLNKNEPPSTFPQINSIDFLEPWKNPDFKQKFKEFVKHQKSLQHQGLPDGTDIIDENDDSQDIDQFLNCLPFLMPPALLSGAFPNFNGHINQSLPTASQLSVSSTKSPNFGGKIENVMPNKNLENALHIINGANQSDHTKNLSQDELTTLKLLNSMLPPHLISNITGLDYLSALNLSKGGNSITNTINNFNNNNNPNPTNLNNITNLLYNQLNQSSNAPHNLLALQQNLTSSLPNLNNSHNANAQNFMNSLALLNNLHMLNNNINLTNSNNTDVNNNNNNNNNFNNLLKSFGQQLNNNLMGQPPPLPPSIFTNNVFSNNGTNSFLDIFNQSNTGPLMSNPSSATMFPIPPPFNLLMPFLSAASQNTATSNISTLADENSNVSNQTSHLTMERKPKNEMLHTVRKFPKTKGYISHKRENHSLNTDETNERSPLDNLVIDEEINRLAKGAPTKRRKRGSLKHMVLPPSIPYTAAILQHHNHLSDVNVGTVGNDIIDSAKHVSLLADIKSQLDLLTKLQQTQGLTEDSKSPSNTPKSPITKNHIDAPNLYAANGSPSEIIKDILNISASVQSNTNGSKTLSTVKNLDAPPTSISLLSNSQQSKNNTTKLCQVPLDKKFGGGFQRKTIIRSIKIRRLFSNPLTFHNNSSDQLKELACAADLVRGLKATIKGEVVYLSPCGKKLRSYQDVDRYLDRLDKARAFMESSHRMTYNWISELNSRQHFNFSSKALLGDFYRENPLDPEENLIAYTESETKDLLTYILDAFCASENKVKGAENVDAKHNTVDGSDSPKIREDDLHNIFVNERNALSLNSTNLTELSAVMEKESSVEIFANHPFFTTFGHVMDSHIKRIGRNINNDKNCTPFTIAAEHNIDGNSVSSSVKTETDSMFFIAENCGSDNAMITNTSSAHNLAPNQNATMTNSTHGSGHDLYVKSESQTLHSSFFSVKRRAGRIKKTIFDPTDTPPQSISAPSIAYSHVTENGAKKKDDNCNAMFYSKFYRNSFLGKDNTTTSAPNYSDDKNGNDQIKGNVKIEPTLNKNDSFAFSDNLSECKSHTDSLVEQNDAQSPCNKAADMDRNLSSTLKDVQDSKPNNTTIEPIINTQNITTLTSEFESNNNMSNNETFNINDKKDNSLDISQNPTDHQNIGFSFEDMYKAKDDLEIMQNSKTLPDFPIIPNMQLSPKHFSDLVMVTEFLHSFSDVLHIGPTNYTLYKLQNIICCQNIINGDDIKTKSNMVKDEPVITDKSCAMEKLHENDESNTLLLAMPFQAFIKIVLKLVQFLLKHNELLANATTLININNSNCNNGGVYSNDMCSTIQTENEDFRENENNQETVKEQNFQDTCAKTVTFTSSLDIRYNYDLGTFTFLGGKSVKDFGLCESNISEIVRIYLTIYNDTCYGETSSMSVEITDFLSLQPLHLLKAEQKCWLLAFLCDRLLDHPDILRELDRRLGIMANLKKDKWLNEGGQLRKQRYSDPITNNIAFKKSTTNHNENIDVDKSTKKSVKFEDDLIENTVSNPISTIVKENTHDESVKIADQPSVKSEFVDQDMTKSTSEIEYKPVTIKTDGEKNSMVEKNDTRDNGKNVNSNITTDEKSNHPKEETSQSDQRRCESEIQHPEDRLSMYRMQLYEINTRLRCMSLGTDRYKRIYWVMPSIGAILIEGFNYEREQNNVANLDKSLINMYGVLTNNGKEEDTDRNNLLTSNYQNNWWYIDSREQLDNLMSSLNLRGIREKILYKNMQKITDVLLQMYPLEPKSENGKLISNQFAEYIKSHELSSNNEAKIEPENFLKIYHTNAYKTVQRFEDKVITSNFMSKAWIKTHKPIPNILVNDVGNDEIFSATRQKLLDLVSGIDRRFLRSPLCRPTKDLQDYEAIINWYNSNTLKKDGKFDNIRAKTLENTVTDRKLENMEEKVEMIPKEITDFDQNTHIHCDKNIIVPQDDIVNSSNQFSDSESNDVSNKPNNLNNLQEDNGTNSYAQTSSNLYKWKLALTNAKNTDQIYICLQLLQSAIAWEKSITKVFCQFCHLGSDEDLLLLCDGCDKGYHTYCFKPAIDKVPSGDWYCYSCVSKAINENLCSICGQSKQKLVRCDKCLRHFHERCFNSRTILQRSFKGIWKCPICQTNPKYAKTQNLSNNTKTIYYNHKNLNPHLNASLNSYKPLKNPDKKSDIGSNISKKNSENSITCLIKKRINHDQPKRDMSESETIDAICTNTPKERLKENEKFTTSPHPDSFSIAESAIESAIRPLPVTLQKIDRRRKIFRDYKKFKDNPNVLPTRNDCNTNNLEHHTKEKNALFEVTMNPEPLEKSGINGINLKKYSSLGNKTINYKSSIWTSQEMKKRRGRKFKFVMSGNGDNGTIIRSQKGPKIKSLSNFSNNTTFSNTGNHNMYPTSQHSI